MKVYVHSGHVSPINRSSNNNSHMQSGKMSPVFKFQVKGTISHNQQKVPPCVLAEDDDVFERLSMNKLNFITDDSMLNKRPNTNKRRMRNKSQVNIKMQTQT